jgi:hypothetical protein
VSADFFSWALAIRSADARALIATLAATEKEYNGNVYSDATGELMKWLREETPLVRSPHYAAFVALDRFSLGRKLLFGHASRYIAVDKLAEFERDLRANIATAGGEAGVITATQPHLERGHQSTEAREGLDALFRGIALAHASELDLLLACVTC